MFINIQSLFLDYCWREQEINRQFQSVDLDCCRAAGRGDSVACGPALKHLCLLCTVTVRERCGRTDDLCSSYYLKANPLSRIILQIHKACCLAHQLAPTTS
uniref:Uncharacterized protein n=1 Tax=Gasterosteus aculeatus TaxID=69293 RepID=G3P6P9_GASAC